MFLITPWCPVNKLEWYKAMILSVHISGMASTAASLSGVTVIFKQQWFLTVYIFLLTLPPFLCLP